MESEGRNFSKDRRCVAHVLYDRFAVLRFVGGVLLFCGGMSCTLLRGRWVHVGTLGCPGMTLLWFLEDVGLRFGLCWILFLLFLTFWLQFSRRFMGDPGGNLYAKCDLVTLSCNSSRGL